MSIEPFKFGIATSGEHFTDRKKETERLIANFQHGINTILISPRRWGKTSLVKKASTLATTKELRIVYLDIFACRTEEEFCNAFATAVLKQTSTRAEEWLRNIQDFLSRVSPRVTLGVDPTAGMSLSIDLRGVERGLEEVLEFPEKYAKKHNCRIVICIDEFQQIGEFANSLTFQKKLRTIWQHQKQVSYCLFGSKKHLMDELFGRKDYPFYKFGDMIYLGKISTEDWVAYISERFLTTGKEIPTELAKKIAKAVDNHSSYVQQLAWLVWGRTEKRATEDDLERAIEDLINQNRPLFEKQTEELTSHQLSLLRTIVDGNNNSFTSQRIIDDYNLNSSANANAVKNALTNKELIDTDNGHTYITDPVFTLWLSRYLFYR